MHFCRYGHLSDGMRMPWLHWQMSRGLPPRMGPTTWLPALWAVLAELLQHQCSSGTTATTGGLGDIGYTGTRQGEWGKSGSVITVTSYNSWRFKLTETWPFVQQLVQVNNNKENTNALNNWPSLAQWSPADCPHKGPVMQKTFGLRVMTSSSNIFLPLHVSFLTNPYINDFSGLALSASRAVRVSHVFVGKRPLWKRHFQ